MNEKKLTRSELKRAAVIDAAMVEFQSKGFKAASMDDIAKRAEVSKRTVYNHFSNKEALFNAIMLEMLAMLSAFEQVPFSLDIPIKEQLGQLVAHEISLLKAEGFIAAAKVIIAETIHSPELIHDAMATLSKQESPLATWFNAAIEAGAIKTEHPEIVVTQFLAVIKAFCFWPQLIQGAEFPDEAKLALISDTAVQMIIKQYTQAP